MIPARINPGPRLASPRKGKLVRVEKWLPHSAYDLSRHDGSLAIVVDHKPEYTKVRLAVQGVLREFVLSAKSVLRSVAVSEANDHRQKIADTLKSSPVGTGGGFFTTGTDPELFTLSGNGHVIPAWNFLPCKKEPLKEVWHSHNGRRGGLFWDGFQAEWTCPPCNCHQYLADYLQSGIKNIYNRAIALDPQATVTHQCVIDVDDDTLATSPSDGVALGCEPSLNAYTDAPNPVLAEVQPLSLPIRFAGFHVHYGIGKKSEAEYRRIVKLTDAIAGVISVPLLAGLEDPRRRVFYGLAGEYRTPEHGLEYRVFSSAGLVHPAVSHLLLDMSRQAVRLSLDGFSFIWDSNPDEVRECINNLDVGLSKKIISRNSGVLNALLSAWGGTYPSTALKLIDQGAKNLLSTDMVSNWRLKDTWKPHSDSDNCCILNTTLP